MEGRANFDAALCPKPRGDASAKVIDCTTEWLYLDIGGFFAFPLDDVRLLGNSLILLTSYRLKFLNDIDARREEGSFR